MSAANKAVFLSYASQDADAARRVCDALQATGVEVWFDQSELVGGDAWDQKIRGQIKACALFVPMISASTQARREGYFRLEWKLAAQRTHTIADGTPFLLPIVIDATTDADALVPEEFRSVQWTRLPRAEPTEAFVARVTNLLVGPTVKTTSAEPAKAAAPGVFPVPRKPTPWRWCVIALGIVLTGIGGYIAVRPAAKESAGRAATKVFGEANGAHAAAAVSDKTVPGDKSIAVLPFANMSDDKDANAFFADGIHEDILTNLALIRELRVVSRTSVLGYRNTTKKIGEIGRELGVAYVLEGSVRRAGNKVRVTGQLIRAENDEHLWAKSFDRDLTDVFSIQAALAQEIAGALKLALSPEEKKLIGRRLTESAAAYDLYLKVRALPRGSRDGSARERTESLLFAAVELDPEFAAAWARWANHQTMAIYNGADGTASRAAKAKAALDRAVALAPESPEVLWSLAACHMYNGNYDQAIESVTTLLRLQPNEAFGHFTMGGILRRRGRWNEAIGRYTTATQLAASDAFSARLLAEVLTQCRQWDKAEAEQRRLTTLARGNVEEQAALVRLTYLARGSRQESDTFFKQLTLALPRSEQSIAMQKDWAAASGDFKEARRLDELQPYFSDGRESAAEQAAQAAGVLLALGDVAAARKRLDLWPAVLRFRLQSEPGNAHVWRDLGVMEAVLGNKEEALRCARKAAELRPPTKDAVAGPRFRFSLAVVLALTGDKVEAVAELSRLLAAPSEVNVHELRSGPWFVSLRRDPHFEALLNDPKNNAPLF